MQTIRFRCPECQSSLRVDVKYAGSERRCPQPACGALISIPPLSASEKETDSKSASAQKSPAKKKSFPKAMPEANAQSASASRPARESRKETRKGRSASLPPAPPTRRDLANRAATGKKTQKSKKTGKKSLWPRVGAVVAVVLAAGAVSYLMPSSNTGDVSEQSNAVRASSQDSFSHRVQPFLQKYCYDCHGEDLQEGGIRLDNHDGNPDIIANHAMWSKVYRQISIGSMPPQDMDLPSEEERGSVSNWLDQAVNHFDCGDVNNPGRVTVHRLNRSEYDNTVRDLTGLDLNLSRNFPSDDVGYGFDNIGDVLTLSPILLERYLDAAEKITEAAITLPEQLKIDHKWTTNDFEMGRSAKAQGNTVAFISVGDATKKFPVKVAGKYQFEMEVSATQAGDEDAEFIVLFDNKEIATYQVPGHRQNKKIRWEQTVSSGKHELKISYTKDKYDPEAEDPKRRDRNFYLNYVQVSGPERLEAKDFPERHRKLVTQTPNKNQTAEEAARKVLQPFMDRAYRRPATIQEVDQVMKIFHIAQGREESYERSLQIALQGVLISPEFLFRIEAKADSAKAGEIKNLGDYELASRLSYFLWSSMPDQKLFDLAAQGQLHQPDVLEQQVRRMLQDQKAQAFTQNFVGQWLGLRKLQETKPDAELFPEYNAELAVHMSRETEMLFGEILKKDGSLVELITADYTFLNEPLAKLYGIEGVKGKEFQRVSLTETPRRGLIAHAGVLTLTSFPDRTSPVKRGEWVLENILAQAPPPAPASVPGLEETQKANPNMSFREQLVLHQKDPICSSCHKLMDGIGFGLQNFDAIGRWRVEEGKFPIDARGDLPGGISFNGPVELVEVLKQKPDDFTRCVSEKMLTYALGRGLEWYDKCLIDDIIANVRKDNYRLSRVVVEIVLSDAFRSRRVEK